MKKFKFSLQAVLIVRELELNRAETAYAQALKEWRTMEAQSQQLQSDIAALQKQMERACSDSFSPGQHQHYILAQTNAFQALAHQEQQKAQLKEVENEKLKQFLHCKRTYDALLEIKDKKFKEHLKEEAKREEREIEDIFMNRYSPSVG